MKISLKTREVALAAWIAGLVFAFTAVFTTVYYENDIFTPLGWLVRIGTLGVLPAILLFFVAWSKADGNTRQQKLIQVLPFAFLALSVSAFEIRILYDTTFAAGLDDHTAAPHGEPTAYRVVDGYETARKFAAPEGRLQSIAAEKVASDGTLDVFQPYHPKVMYTFWGPNRPEPGYAKKVRQSDFGWPPRVFLDEPEPEPKPMPIGSGMRPAEPAPVVTELPFREYIVTVAKPKKRDFYGRDLVAAKQKGGHWPYQYAWERPMRLKWGKTATTMPPTIDGPACSFAELWKTAMTKGAPEGAVAAIHYDAKGYRFRIDEVKVDLAFDPACELLSIVSLHYELPGMRAPVTLKVNGQSWGEVKWVYELGHYFQELIVPPGTYQISMQYGSREPATATLKLKPGEKQVVNL